MTGFVPLRRKSTVDAAKLVGLLLMGMWMIPCDGWAEEQLLLRPYEIVGDAIPDSLTGSQGGPHRRSCDRPQSTEHLSALPLGSLSRGEVSGERRA
jgi:hypothetical protein